MCSSGGRRSEISITFVYLILQPRPWLYLEYNSLCLQTDRHESRQTDKPAYWKSCDFFEGQGFLPYRQVFVCEFNSKVLTWQHVVLYSDGDMDYFFPASSLSGSGQMTSNSLVYEETPVWCMWESFITLFWTHNTHIHIHTSFFSLF